jgi:spermidine synthase
MACARLRTAAPRVLIGGYGMGFTLRAVLRAVGPAARVEVAELVPKIIDWARGPMAEIFAGSLDDPRVSVSLCDVGAMIREAPRAWDAILLDVDNGPDGLTRQENDALYTEPGLAAARGALRPGGVLAVYEHVRSRRRVLGWLEDAVAPAWASLAARRKRCVPARLGVEPGTSSGWPAPEVTPAAPAAGS